MKIAQVKDVNYLLKILIRPQLNSMAFGKSKALASFDVCSVEDTVVTLVLIGREISTYAHAYQPDPTRKITDNENV